MSWNNYSDESVAYVLYWLDCVAETYNKELRAILPISSARHQSTPHGTITTMAAMMATIANSGKKTHSPLGDTFGPTLTRDHQRALETTIPTAGEMWIITLWIAAGIEITIMERYLASLRWNGWRKSWLNRTPLSRSLFQGVMSWREVWLVTWRISVSWSRSIRYQAFYSTLGISIGTNSNRRGCPTGPTELSKSLPLALQESRSGLLLSYPLTLAWRTQKFWRSSTLQIPRINETQLGQTMQL